MKAHSEIKIHTGTSIQKIAGAPGMFDVTLSNGETNAGRLDCSGGRLEAVRPDQT